MGKLEDMHTPVADARLTSVTRWSVRGKWGGVRFDHLLATAEIKSEATHVQLVSYREVYTTSIPLALGRRADTDL